MKLGGRGLVKIGLGNLEKIGMSVRPCVRALTYVCVLMMYCVQVYTFVEYSDSYPMIWVIKDGKAECALFDKCQDTSIMLQFLKNHGNVRPVVFRTFLAEFKRLMSQDTIWLSLMTEAHRGMYETILGRHKVDLNSRPSVLRDLDAMEDDDEEDDGDDGDDEDLFESIFK